MKVETMRPALVGETYRLRGEVVRMARQVAYAEATVSDGEDQLVSRSTGTFLLHRSSGQLPAPDTTRRRTWRSLTHGPTHLAARRSGSVAAIRSRPPACVKASATMALPVSHAPACRVCDGPTHTGFALCFCCTTLVRQLQMPLVPVAAVADYRVGDEMHRQLRGYKDAPVAETRRALARRTGRADRAVDGGQPGAAATAVRVGLGRGRHGALVHRPTGAPVDALVAQVPALARRHRRLLVRGPGATDHLWRLAGGSRWHRRSTGSWLRSRRVLVFDDTITTGARAQSAAAALRMAGARVAGVVAVGGLGVGAVRPSPTRPTAAGFGPRGVPLG